MSLTLAGAGVRPIEQPTTPAAVESTDDPPAGPRTTTGYETPLLHKVIAFGTGMSVILAISSLADSRLPRLGQYGMAAALFAGLAASVGTVAGLKAIDP